jgi:hypothetical protein
MAEKKQERLLPFQAERQRLFIPPFFVPFAAIPVSCDLCVLSRLSPINVHFSRKARPVVDGRHEKRAIQ